MKNRIIIIGVITVLIVGAGSFFAGLRYAQSKKIVGGDANFGNLSSAERQQRVSQMGNSQGRAGGGQAGMGFVTGEIIAKDDKSVTVKLRDGGSKIVFYSASTQLQKMTDTSLGDFVIGKQVTVNGAVNSDGSVTAQIIQLRPDMQPSGSPIIQPAGN